MKRILFVVLLLIGAGIPFSYSQNKTFTHRKSFWNEENFFGSITADKKWQYQVDYQYRRMADADFVPDGNTSNIFKDPYQQVLRPWIHYWIKPGAVRLSLSPLGYWITWTPPKEGAINKVDGANVGKTTFPEFRICPQITTVQNVGRVQITNRYRYEFRWVGSRTASSNNLSDFGDGYSFAPNGTNGSNHLGRLRLQFRAQLPITKPKIEKNTIYLNAWDELFLGIGKNVANNKILNQNRVVGLIGWKLPTEFPIKIEAGVTYQSVYNYNIDTQFPGQNLMKKNVDINTAYTVYIIFDEFHTLFKKKAKPAAE